MRELVLAVVGLVIASASVSAGEIKDIQWRIGPNLPEFRKGGCLCVLDGKVISVFGMRQPWGEMDTMYVYDPATDWWSRGVNGPVGQCYVQGTVCDGAFFAVGGRKGQVRKECYRLEVKNGSHVWSQIASLNDARGWAPSVAVGDALYVFGGAKGGHGPTMSSVERLDTSKPDAKWEIVSKIPGDSRGWLGAAAVGGKVYVIGGSHFFDEKQPDGTDRKRFAEVLEFDPETKGWATRAPLPYRLAGMDCEVYDDRYIIVVGGAPDVDDFTEEMKAAYEKTDRYESYYCPFIMDYDVQDDSWRRLPSPLPVPTNDVRVVRIDKTLYVLGGENIEYATSNTTPWLRIGEIVE
jgi:N-acetylneuraminic acid mutarotase